MRTLGNAAELENVAKGKNRRAKNPGRPRCGFATQLFRPGFEPRPFARHAPKSHTDRALRIEDYGGDATRMERLKTGAD
jgi:hypothetical protein